VAAFDISFGLLLAVVDRAAAAMRASSWGIFADAAASLDANALLFVLLSAALTACALLVIFMVVCKPQVRCDASPPRSYSPHLQGTPAHRLSVSRGLPPFD